MKATSTTPNGFSLVDLIIVLSVISILVTLALPQFKKATLHFTRKNAAEELKSFLDRARFDSIKRHAKSINQMATVTLNDSRSFTLKSDLNSDGEIDISETKSIVLNEKSNIKITGNNLVFPLTISFNYLGQVNVVDGNNVRIEPKLIICDRNTPTNESSTTLMISRAGSISLQEGINENSNITVPQTSNITASQIIKTNALVSNSSYLD